MVNGLTEQEASNKLVASVGAGKAYIRGFEIVNKESKYLSLNKSRESLERDNITLKHSGLASFYLTNTYNTVPLNSFGADLTAYPTLYLNGVFGDGSLGQNNTEPTTDGLGTNGEIDGHKQTRVRRTNNYSSDQAIKTVLVDITTTASGKTFSDITNAGWELSLIHI